MNPKLTRRQFIHTSARGAVVIGAATTPFFMGGCTNKRQYDLIITGGTVFDGLGNPGMERDVAIKDDRIVYVGTRLNRNRAGRIIEAKGMVVSPGFIDMHTHTDVQLLANPLAESHIRQGITTEISGNCGSSPFPISQETADEVREYMQKKYEVELTWNDMEGFFQRLEEKGMSLNYATLVGHGDLRGSVVGFNDVPATAKQIVRMQSVLEHYMRGGAWGLSTGLEYPPGSYADTEEIIELCRVVTAQNGIYATHMRDEGDGVLESIDEAIRIATETGVSTQISHLKMAYPRNWHKIDAALEKIEKAHQDGIRILADRYPYIAASTGLSIFFPLWARQGTTKDIIKRLQDPSLDKKLRAHLKEEEVKIGTWKNVVIADVVTEKNRSLEGMNIVDAAKKSGKKPYEFMRDLLVEEENAVDMVEFIMKEENLQRILAHPLVSIGSDGNAVAPYGVLHKGKPHPRFYGTFPRVLGKYVREDKILTMPRAIQKMTSVPAGKFGFRGRGRISEGYYADIVVFDPDRVSDKATWEDPHQYPEGIDYVMVNGQVAVSEGETTGALPGRILRKTD